MSDIDKLFEEGMTLLNDLEFKKAEKKFKKIISADPDNAEAYFRLAEVSENIPKYSSMDVGMLYREAIKRDPENALFYVQYSDFCLSNAWMKPAEDNILKAMEYDKDNAPMFLNDFSFAYQNNGMLFRDRLKTMFKMDTDDISAVALKYALNGFGLSPNQAKPILENTEPVHLDAINKDEKEFSLLQKDKSVEELLSFMDEYPEDPAVLREVGHSCLEKGLLDLGQYYYVAAAKIDKQQDKYYLNDLAYDYYINALDFAQERDLEKEDILKTALKYKLKAMRITPSRAVDLLDKME